MIARTSSVGMRREMLLGDLRRNPLSTSREICDRILEETGGVPTLLTGAIYYPAHVVLQDLYALEKREVVQRVQIEGTRTIGWMPCEGREDG